MQHACRKQKAMLQPAKIRRFRHTPAIMARPEPQAGRLEHFPAKPVPDLIRDGRRFAVENATKYRIYRSRPAKMPPESPRELRFRGAPRATTETALFVEPIEGMQGPDRKLGAG